MDTSRTKIIYVLNPTTHTCEEGDGIIRGVFKVSLTEWNKIGQIIKTKELSRYEEDFTSGGHGCIIAFNLIKIYNKCIILDDVNPVIFDVFEDDSLLDILREATSE